MQQQLGLATAPAANTFGSLREPALRYSLLKRDANSQDFVPVSEADLKPGDLVRLQVLVNTPGNLILTRLNESGEWQRIAEAAAQIKSPTNFPDTPIQVEASAQRYRLTLDTVGPQAKVVGGIAGVPPREMRAAAGTASVPATIEITLQGKP